MSAADQAMAETSEAMDTSGSEGAPSSNPVPDSATPNDAGAPSRPEWLLEGYDSPEAQAQALHKYHQEYGGQHETYAQQGSWFSQRYYSDPVFKQWVDDYNQGKHQQAPQQQQAPQAPPPYDVNNPETVDKFWNEGIANPDKIFQIAEERAFQRIQKELGPQLAQLKQQQAQLEARRIFQQHGSMLQEMRKSPYGQQLLSLTQRGMNVEEAIALYQAAKQQAQAAPQEQAAPKAAEAVRDPQGRFQRTAGNGRRAGTSQTGKSKTTSEILAETRAKFKV